MPGDLVTYKEAAAWRAVEFVKPGMVVGLGAGSTATLAVRRIGELLRSGKLFDIVGIPCSLETEHEARQMQIPLTSLDEQLWIDLTIDGADEVDTDFNLIKGGGGALLREKMVAQASRREIIVVDEGKLSPRIGTHWALPVEVVPFGWRAQARFIASLGGRPQQRLRETGEPYTTDQGNVILDCAFGPIADPAGLASALAGRAGIVEHGLFLGLATDVIVAGAQGVRHLVAGRDQVAP